MPEVLHASEYEGISEDLELKSVVVQEGNSADRGHYVIYVKQNEKWYKLDDLKSETDPHELSKSERTKFESVTMHQGYDYVYAKKDGSFDKLPAINLSGINFRYGVNNTCFAISSLQQYVHRPHIEQVLFNTYDSPLGLPAPCFSHAADDGISDDDFNLQKSEAYEAYIFNKMILQLFYKQYVALSKPDSNIDYIVGETDADKAFLRSELDV